MNGKETRFKDNTIPPVEGATLDIVVYLEN